MAIINITSGNFSVTDEGNTPYGNSVIRTEINGVIHITEDITKQVLPGKYSYITSYSFVSSSLEVFVNGLKASHDFDFSEKTSLDGFDFVLYDGNFNRWLPGTSVVIIKYIKSS